MNDQKIFKVKIVDVNIMPPTTREFIEEQVSKRGEEFAKKYQGFVKIVYAISSPPKIVSIEPIKGNINDYFKSIGIEEKSFSVF